MDIIRDVIRDLLSEKDSHHNVVFKSLTLESSQMADRTMFTYLVVYLSRGVLHTHKSVLEKLITRENHKKQHLILNVMYTSIYVKLLPLPISSLPPYDHASSLDPWGPKSLLKNLQNEYIMRKGELLRKGRVGERAEEHGSLEVFPC